MHALPQHIMAPSASTMSTCPCTYNAQSARQQAEIEDVSAAHALLEDNESDFSTRTAGKMHCRVPQGA